MNYCLRLLLNKFVRDNIYFTMPRGLKLVLILSKCHLVVLTKAILKVKKGEINQMQIDRNEKEIAWSYPVAETQSFLFSLICLLLNRI